jgi:mannose-6-phosphate isomerase-like protein (cupin superfamily)
VLKPNDEIDNPGTGERVVFRKTSAETDGAAVVVETFLRPYATGLRTHLHPAQEERFEVLKGSVGFQVGRRQLVAGPGHRLTVPAGTPHRVWNAGDEEAQVLSEIRPALRFEQLITALHVLGSGRSGLARLARVGRMYPDTIRFSLSPLPGLTAKRLRLRRLSRRL